MIEVRHSALPLYFFHTICFHIIIKYYFNMWQYKVFPYLWTSIIIKTTILCFQEL